MSMHIYKLANGQNVKVERKNGRMIVHHNLGIIETAEPRSYCPCAGRAFDNFEHFDNCPGV